MTSALRQEGRLWRWCRKGYERLRPFASSRWFYVLVLVSTIFTLLQFVDMRSMNFVQILSNIGASFQGSTPSETLRWNTNHDRWIVIDVTSGRSCPSRDLTEAPPGWRIILSGETTHECVFPKCRMLSFQNKGNNKEREKGLSPINHAYMEAISLGAETVITVDCMAPMSLSEIVHLLTEQRSQSTVRRSQSTASSDGLPRHSKDGKYRERGLMYNSTTLFNAYAHFGAWTGVPRAFHSTRQVVEPNSRHYYVRDFHRVFVVHALSDASDDLVETRTRERDETLDGVSQQKQPWTAGHRRRRRSSQDSPNPDSKQANSRGERHGMRFEPWTPHVFVGQRTLTPVVPASSLYKKSGLWALAAPCLHPRWRCEILRQMITQRMLGELDAFTAFYPISAAGQEDNDAGRKLLRRAPIEVLLDDSHPQAPDFDVMELATFLNSWTCEKSLTFFQCYGLLVDQLHSKRFLHLPSRLQTVNWLGNLREANVSEPTRKERPWRGVKKVGEVEVVLQATSVDALLKEKKQVDRLQRGFGDKVKERCTKPIVQKQNNNVKNENQTTNGSIANTSLPYIKPPNLPSVPLWSAPLLEDIVLVVEFNDGGFFMDNLPFLETVHRPYFKHIFYCVPNVQDILSKAKLRKEGDLLKHVNLVEGLSNGWYLMYECVTSVIRIGLPSVRGYLHIGDDTLVNNWKLPDTPLDQVLMTDNNGAREDAHVQKYWWVWWNTNMGRPALIAALAGLERISGLTWEELRDLNSLDDRSGFNQSDLPGGINNATTSPSKNVTWVSYMSLEKKMREDKTVEQPRLFGGTEEWEEPTQEDARRFLRNYYLSNRRTNFLGYLSMDIFYLPHRRSSDFALFSRYFMRHGIMAEMAIPNLVFGISERWGISTFSGMGLWGADRDVLSKFYKKENTFIHPFKLSGDVKNEIGRTFFCETYLVDLYTEWKKQIEEKKQV